MQEVIDSIIKEKIIVIVRGVPTECLLPVADAMYKGGIRLLEITYSANQTISDEETATNIQSLVYNFGESMYIGAGTVLSKKQVLLTKNAGGKFIISPDTNVDIIKETKARGMVSIPGAYSPSEMVCANNAGADFVKIFPAVNLGIEYIKAISAPLSHIKMLAVGGINYNNMKDYMNAGILGFGIGSNIVDKKLISNGDYSALTELAKRYVECVHGE